MFPLTDEKLATEPQQTELLSPRELEVAVLIARGLTNREIAEQLVISRATVSSHVVHILNKLNVRRRSQIAMFAMNQGLAAENGPAPALAPLDRPRFGAGSRVALAALSGVLIVLLGVAFARRPALPALVDTPLPPHGTQLFHLDPAEAPAQFSTVTLHTGGGKPSTFDFLPDGVQITASGGFPLLVAQGIRLDDAVINVRVRQLAGASGFTVQLRGCLNEPDAEDDFYRVNVEPRSGSLAIERARCGPGFVTATMLAPARRFRPPPEGAEVSLAVAASGATVKVYSGGREVASGTDSQPALPPGSVRLGVYPGGTVKVDRFDVYQPPSTSAR